MTESFLAGDIKAVFVRLSVLLRLLLLLPSLFLQADDDVCGGCGGARMIRLGPKYVSTAAIEGGSVTPVIWSMCLHSARVRVLPCSSTQRPLLVRVRSPLRWGSAKRSWRQGEVTAAAAVMVEGGGGGGAWV